MEMCMRIKIEHKRMIVVLVVADDNDLALQKFWKTLKYYET